MKKEDRTMTEGHHDHDSAENLGVWFPLLRAPMALLGFWAIANSWPFDHWTVLAAWAVFTGWFLFSATSCFHETVHQTLYRGRAANVIHGRVIGTVLLVPYTVFREAHVRHHADLNRPTDWELWPYCDPTIAVGWRRVFVWFDLVLGALVAPYIFGRTYFHQRTTIRSPRLRAVIRWEYLAIVLFWGTVLGLVAYYGAWLGFLKVWCLPHLVAGMIQTGRKFTEHLGMASFDPLLGSRTVLGQGWLTRLTSTLNYRLFVHGIHHRHPMVSQDQIEPTMRRYIEERPDAGYPVFATYWQAVWHMVPYLFRNPGLGLNARAPSKG
jgi:fatty acid desaturase